MSDMTNIQTTIVFHWLLADKESLNRSIKLIKENVKLECQNYKLAYELKSMVRNVMHETFEQNKNIHYLMLNLLTVSIQQIDFKSIAQHFLDQDKGQN